MKSFLYTLFFILFLKLSYAQSLQGIWKGKSEYSIWILNPVNIVLEMQIINDSTITGIIHSYYKKDRFEHTKISGTINWKDSIINISEDEEISHNINTKLFELCMGTMYLKLTNSNGLYSLSGKWKDKDNKLFHCPTLEVSFEKPYKDSLSLKQMDSKTRITNIQKVIELNADEVDSIKCSLYDNGIIDDDTASIYFNDSLILKRQKLTERPIEFYISFDKTKQFQKIKLFAENLGKIPPNTALLIIDTKKNRYLITLSSDYSQNGSVEFFLKE